MDKATNMQREIIVSIKQAISEGTYHEGDRLPSEAELAQHFQVARSVVREALSVLKAEGYVRSKRGRNGGFIVANPGFDAVIARLMDLLVTGDITLRQAAEMRLKLESDAVREGMPHVDRPFIESLYAIDRAMRTTEDSAEHTRLNADFHACLGGMSGNRLQGVFLVLLLRFVGQAAEVIATDTHELHSVDEHLPIIRSIEAGDADQACLYLQRHILNAVERLENAEKHALARRIRASCLRRNGPGR